MHTLSTITQGDTLIARVNPGAELISDGQSALDILMTITHLTKARHIALPMTRLAPAFFDLSTGLAGEVLQKVSNYKLKLAIWGDFSGFTSEALRAFILESNRGNTVFFCKDEEEAAERLSKAELV